MSEVHQNSLDQRVIIALDSFKGSISAAGASRAFAEGWLRVQPDSTPVIAPIADGGEGTLQAFAEAVDGAQRMPVTVTGPDDVPRQAEWLLLPPSREAPQGTGVVELASTSGIELLGDRRLPWDAHTRGFGEAIGAALDHGVSRLVLGIGSSCSTDGGMGLLSALWAEFTDAVGQKVPFGARGLPLIERVDLAGLRSVPPTGALVLTDVSNPLLGPNGAAVVFGPQKGFQQAELSEADAVLAHFAALFAIDSSVAGSGAAGGAGFGLRLWGAQLVPGAEVVTELIGLRKAIRSAAAGPLESESWVPPLVVTGEGAYDAQTAGGKGPAHVLRLAQEEGAEVALVAGRIEADQATDSFAYRLSLTELAGSSAAALEDPRTWLAVAGEQLARLRVRRDQAG